MHQPPTNSLSKTTHSSADSNVTPSENTGVTPQAYAQLNPLTVILAVIVVALLGSVFVLLLLTLRSQLSTYERGIERALGEQPTIHANVIAYARCADFAVAKTSSLFLAFIVVLVGALYVLRSADKEFALSVQGLQGRGSLQTSSPGLVMIALGVTLVGLVVFSRSTVSYISPPASAPLTETLRDEGATIDLSTINKGG